MPLARVVQGQISVAVPGQRVPVDFNQGDEVELSKSDFERLVEAGAVEDASEPVEGEEEQEVETVEDEDPEADRSAQVDELASLSHDKLDQMGRKARVTFPAGATKKQKAEALADAEQA